MGGRIGLAFSSPPYYNEEDYIIGDQSYKPGVSYSDWVENYLRKTIQNIYFYLIDDGVFCVNVKNIGEYRLEDDIVKIAEEEGFEAMGAETLRNHRRPHAINGMTDNSEKIFCFKKRELVSTKC